MLDQLAACVEDAVTTSVAWCTQVATYVVQRSFGISDAGVGMANSHAPGKGAAVAASRGKEPWAYACNAKGLTVGLALPSPY
jgi:hypothetical protein